MKKIPIPSLINWLWNFGFIISIMISIQSMTGLLLSMNYMNSNNSFNNNMKIFFNNNWGWLMRIMHMNFPSFIVISMIIHMMRNIFFNSNNNMLMWNSGFIMLLMMMLTSFLGYTLPWSQMSYWGLMVITNSISVIPMIGKTMMIMLWGNFNINETTLNRMFIIHFSIPLMLMLMIMIHINILHKNLSFNQLGTSNKIDMISLKSYFIIKDTLLIMMMMFILLNFMMMNPMTLNNPDNFILMNMIITPNMIEPEWYFMLFYSILRMINNKLGGMILSSLMLLMIYFMPIMMKKKFQSNKFYLMNKINLTMMMSMLIMISMLGFKKMELPYTLMNKKMIKMVFLMFTLMLFLNNLNDKIM